MGDKINKNSQDYMFAQLATSIEGINKNMEGLRVDLKETNQNFQMFQKSACDDIASIKEEIAFIKGKLVVWTLLGATAISAVGVIVSKVISK